MRKTMSLVAVVGGMLCPHTTLHAAPPAAAPQTAAPQTATLETATLEMTRETKRESPDRVDEILATYLVSDGTVFQLAEPMLDSLGRTHASVPDPNGGKPLHLVLRPYSVRAKDFALVAYNSKGLPVSVDAGEPSTVRGMVDGDLDSRVAGSLVDGRLTLSIRLGDGRRYFVDSLAFTVAGVAVNEHLVFDASDRLEIEAHCGAGDGHEVGGVFGQRGHGGEGDGGVAGEGGVAGALCDTQLVVDCDFPYFNAVGGTVDLAARRVETIINIVNDQYESEVGIRHLLTGIVVRTSAGSDPYVSNLLCAAPDLLGEVSTYWTNVQGAPYAGITRDMVHLFTGRADPTSGVVGCAWIGDVCANETDYVAHGASRAAFTPNTAFITDLVAHEMGHNWGGVHCTCSSPPSTMNAFLTGANTFTNSPSIGHITAWRTDHSSCLDCAGTAIDGCGDPVAASAWEPHTSRFAYQSACCARVCVDDPYCCNTQWDTICANAARARCAGCGDPATGSPYTARSNPGCSDASCCATICTRDPFCCDTRWDSVCVSQSESLCRSGLTCADARLINTSIPESLNFTTSNDGSASDETTCGTGDVYATWLRYRPTCSGMSTLSICTDFAEGQVNIAAFSACGGTELACSATDSGCGIANGGVQIKFAALAGQTYLIRIAANNNGRVAGSLSIACAAVCGSGASCANASPSPGCSDASCCVNVCTVDPFCCNTMWDSICANSARDLCYRDGDLNFDGVVNAADLTILLNGWGGAGASDINGDGTTNAADLAVLLGNWG